MTNGLFQYITVEESTSIQWVKVYDGLVSDQYGCGANIQTKTPQVATGSNDQPFQGGVSGVVN